MSVVTYPHGLSKSKITLFEQCPKRLWLSVHRPELADVDDGTRHAFSDGHRVGALACGAYPDGIMISDEDGLTAALTRTASLLGEGWDGPIFEGTFARDGVLVRVDLMLPHDGGWHLAEVKNTTGVKPYHLGDVATQLWVLDGCGVKITAASIRHIDRSFTLTAEGDYRGLFADTFVDAEVAPIVATRADTVTLAREALGGDEPVRDIGAHCDIPFSCSFKSYCGRDLPPAPQWPVTLLPDAAGKKLARQLGEQGIEDLMHVPAGAMPSPKLARIHDVTLSGEAWRDRDAICAIVEDWSYPRIFLDFETIALSVPRWIGTRPYQQVPFQWSAHMVEEGGTVTHAEYLSLDGTDPRRGCAEALAQLPGEGAVIAWNAPFERSCLLGLAAEFEDLAPVLASLSGRLVDLLPVARQHYYHRDMRGSWSIKAVLPTLSPIGYDSLVEVKSGQDAQVGYLEAIEPATDPARIEALRQALLDYCRRDTEAMMIVLGALCL